MEQNSPKKCNVCSSVNLSLVKKNNVTGDLNECNFAITNKDYGVTTDIFRCEDCGFMMCLGIPDVLRFYSNLEDPDYEESRETREIQEKKLLDKISNFKESGRLIDIGAASGILVEKAIERGYDAVGIEPCLWLKKKAVLRGVPVIEGVLPHPEIDGPYDIVCLIDLIEHVAEPFDLLLKIKDILSDDGIVVVVTPDVCSFAARLLRWKWWHYRIAHIGYFSLVTLDRLFCRAGFNRIAYSRPGWYFSFNYLIERVNQYLPGKLRFPNRSLLKRAIIPVNLRDSIFGVYKLAGEKEA